MPNPKRFRYYITDTMNGCVKGSNSTETAEDFAACEDYFVVDSETGEWVNTGGRTPVETV